MGDELWFTFSQSGHSDLTSVSSNPCQKQKGPDSPGRRDFDGGKIGDQTVRGEEISTGENK